MAKQIIYWVGDHAPAWEIFFAVYLRKTPGEEDLCQCLTGDTRQRKVPLYPRHPDALLASWQLCLPSIF
jgi:hypothetical protein